MRAAHSEASSAEEAIASPYLLWGIWLFWLFFLAQPLVMIWALPATPAKLLHLATLPIFIAVYLRLTWLEAVRLTRADPREEAPDRTWWVLIGALLALAVAATLLEGAVSLGSLIYVSASASGRLAGRRLPLLLGGLMLLALLLGLLTRTPAEQIGQVLFITPAVGTVVYFFSRAIRINQELRRARRQVTYLAVTEERLRIARDLHDLLGHSLSLIALKSELAGQLLAEDPARAQTEVRDIEAAARAALVEVREAVSGYRQMTLAGELGHAQELLQAAGVACVVQAEVEALPRQVEMPLAWVLREGVTNVMRHSRARQCQITLTRDAQAVRITISDDGIGADALVVRQGNGLSGLMERVAAHGGTCTAGAAGPDGRGFTLAASVPLVPQAAGAEGGAA